MTERLPGRGRWRTCAVCSAMYISDPQGWAEHEEEAGHRPIRYRLRRRVHIPVEVRRAVYERDGFTCRECGFHADEWAEGPKVRAEGNFLTLDHHQPWALGGSNDESNLVTLCWDCNQAKAVEDRARIRRIFEYFEEIGDPIIPPWGVAHA